MKAFADPMVYRLTMTESLQEEEQTGVLSRFAPFFT